VRLVAEFAVEEGGFVSGGEHVHDNCSEQFQVLSGSMTFVVNGAKRTLGPGEQFTVPPGAWHRWWNSGDGEVRTQVRVDPALRVEEAILVMWGLCADGHTNAKGMPSPLLGALLATRYWDEVRFRQPPEIVQRVLLPPLAALARALGKERTIDRYLRLDSHPSAQASLGRLPERVMRRG
jgi:Cupin domain